MQFLLLKIWSVCQFLKNKTYFSKMNFDFSVLNFTVCHVYHIYVSNLHCSLSLLIECWIYFFVLWGPDLRADSLFYLNTSSLQGLFVLGLETSQPQPWVFAEWLALVRLSSTINCMDQLYMTLLILQVEGQWLFSMALWAFRYVNFLQID